MQIEKTIGDNLNVSNEEQVFDRAIIAWNKHQKASDALKELMCSDLDSKELLLAAFFVGRMQERGRMMSETMEKHLSAYIETLTK